MLQDIYSELDEKVLAAAFLAAVSDIQRDPRERKRGLPPEISQRLFGDLRQMADKNQKESERVFLKAEFDLDGVAEGRQARRYDRGETSMSFRVARDALSAAAWGALINEQPKWLESIEAWWARLDFLEAAQETIKIVKRRVDSSCLDGALILFKQQLGQISRRAELIGQANLKQFGTNLSHSDR